MAKGLGKILEPVDFRDVAGSLETPSMDKIVIDAYHMAGYRGGSFEGSSFTVRQKSVDLIGPSYSEFMLYGRKPGKMPPMEPIAGWCRKYGITASPWAIAAKIAKRGTEGNDFLSPVMDEVVSDLNSQLSRIISEQLINK